MIDEASGPVWAGFEVLQPRRWTAALRPVPGKREAEPASGTGRVTNYRAEFVAIL